MGAADDSRVHVLLAHICLQLLVPDTVPVNALAAPRGLRGMADVARRYHVGIQTAGQTIVRQIHTHALASGTARTVHPSMSQTWRHRHSDKPLSKCGTAGKGCSGAGGWQVRQLRGSQLQAAHAEHDFVRVQLGAPVLLLGRQGAGGALLHVPDRPAADGA